MWTTLFAVSIAAAIGFALAACDLSRVVDALRGRNTAAHGGRGRVNGSRQSEGATSEWWDHSLLLERMKFLHIDTDEFVRKDPIMFRRLALECWRCTSKRECRQEQELAEGSGSEAWKDYCPNASPLSTISTLWSIGIALPAAADHITPSTDGEQVRAITRH
ncbi:MAG TPA: hypothetical protein VGF60_23525 [Xanthobacteraceae bacterium]|jgi:hypothetical protein